MAERTDPLVMRPGGVAPAATSALERARAVSDLVQALPDAAAPPELSDDARKAISALLSTHKSANTRLSYETGMRLFAAWYMLTYGQGITLPVAPEAILHFLADYADGDDVPRSDTREPVDAELVRHGYKRRPGPLRFATLKLRLAGVAAFHLERDLPSPMAHPIIRRAMAAAKKRARLAGRLRPRKKTPLLEEVVDLSPDQDLRSIRDRALILFGWASGGRRRSEIATATHDCLDRDPAPGLAFTYRLSGAKWQSEEDERALPVRGVAAEALARWLAACVEQGLSPEGPIFRRMAGNRIQAQGLTGQQVARIVRSRALQAGFEGDFAGHSLRHGFTTASHRAGVALPDIAEMTAHRHLDTVAGYIEPNPHGNPAAWLLGGGAAKARDPDD